MNLTPTEEDVMRTVCLVTLFATLASGALAADHSTHAAAAPKEMNALKKLVGRWQGKGKMGDKEIPVTIVYELTAGGSTVLEKLFPGTPHEMVSVYTAEGDKVVMTHYCAMGNHPKMSLRKADAKSLAFEMVGTEGIGSANEMHMHAMTVSFVDADHIKEAWTSYENGARKDEKTFDLTRSK
jgi:hypothetical protein